jgi:hypothetical protein
MRGAYQLGRPPTISARPAAIDSKVPASRTSQRQAVVDIARASVEIARADVA